MVYNKTWAKEYYQRPDVKKRMRIYFIRYKKRCYQKDTCEIIKNHHEEMKNDPEHLTTEFIKKLIKIDCKET